MPNVPSNQPPFSDPPTNRPGEQLDAQLGEPSFPGALVRDLQSLYQGRVVVPEQIDRAVISAGRARAADLRQRRMRIVLMRAAGGLAAAAAVTFAVYMAWPTARPGAGGIAMNKPLAETAVPGAIDLDAAKPGDKLASATGRAVPSSPGSAGPAQQPGEVAAALDASEEFADKKDARTAGRASKRTKAAQTGDLNRDGSVDIVDALLLAREVVSGTAEKNAGDRAAMQNPLMCI